ncbi:MAG TPA: cupin domain-containing protein [Bryobacteraceae bacterium]|nr:cupin domain-containing protein [Bryobacteraceae bacterium]
MRSSLRQALLSSMNSTTIAAPLAGGLLGSADNNFVIAEWQDAGGVSERPRLIAPLHRHRHDDEAWYVREGTLRVRPGDDVVEARAGSGVLAPRGTPHTYWNPGPGRARYLLVMTSNIHRLIKAIHEMPERTPAVLRAVFEKHDSELL